MIKLYKSLSGNYIKQSKAYKTGYIISEDKGYSWKQLQAPVALVLIGMHAYKLIGNNYRRNK